MLWVVIDPYGKTNIIRIKTEGNVVVFMEQADKNIASNVSAAWTDKCRVLAREIKLGQRYDQLSTHIREACEQLCHAVRMRRSSDDMPCYDLNIDEGWAPPLPTGLSPHWSAPYNWYSWPTSTADSTTVPRIRLR